MTTVAIIGVDGQLGSDLHAAFEDQADVALVPLTIDDVNICDFNATRTVLRMNRPELVINTAAFSRVDACEDQPDEAFLVNAAAVHNLAVVCRELDATLMHFSTDFVMGGGVERTVPFAEHEPPNPQSVYATSKLAGEYAVRNVGGKHLVIRTCGLYGVAARQAGRASNNFVEVMLARAAEGKPLRVVDDQRVAPTATAELAPKLIELWRAGAQGLFHVTAAGSCTWYEFAVELFRLIGQAADLKPIASRDWGAKAARPAYSVLDNARLRGLGLAPLRPWQAALADYVAARRG